MILMGILLASKDYGTYFNLSQNMFHHLYVCRAILVLLIFQCIILNQG